MGGHEIQSEAPTPKEVEYAEITPELHAAFTNRMQLLVAPYPRFLRVHNGLKDLGIGSVEFDELGRLSVVKLFDCNITQTITYTDSGFINSITDESPKSTKRESYIYSLPKELEVHFPVAVRVQDLDPQILEPIDDGVIYNLEDIYKNYQLPEE